MALVVWYIPEPEWFHNHQLLGSVTELPTDTNEKRVSNKKILLTGIITALGNKIDPFCFNSL
jgi:hypothetical protein